MEKFYTCEEVSEHCNVSIWTVWGWCRDKKLAASRIGGKNYRISESDLEAFMRKYRNITDEDQKEE